MEPMLRPCKPNNLGKGSHGNFYLLIGLSASYQLILNPLTSKKIKYIYVEDTLYQRVIMEDWDRTKLAGEILGDVQTSSYRRWSHKSFLVCGSVQILIKYAIMVLFQV